MVVRPCEIESLDGFQNDDLSEDWKFHDPSFEWTAELEREEEYERQRMQFLAGWWEMEGVRCATFGRDPNRNPYL